MHKNKKIERALWLPSNTTRSSEKQAAFTAHAISRCGSRKDSNISATIHAGWE
jgi:hypothetical protein